MLPEQGVGAAGKRGGGAGGQSRRARQPERRWTPADMQAAGRGSPRLGLWALPQERRWPVAERGLFARQTGSRYCHSKATGAV